MDSEKLIEAIDQHKPIPANPPVVQNAVQTITPGWNANWDNRSGKKVGNLGRAWTFPSDHIPIGGTIKASNQSIKVATFNVLNGAYINHITDGNAQGLKGSKITKNETPSSIAGLTKRDVENLNLVVNLLTASRTDYLALQECSHNFEKELKNRLGNNFGINASGTGVDRQLYIYNKAKLTPVGNPKVTTIERSKKITESIFKDKNGQEYAFIGVHLAGGPKGKNAREQLASHLANNYDPNRITVVLGDMNAKSLDVGQAIESEFMNRAVPNPFNYLTQGTPTHINTKQEAQDYDSIHISAPQGVSFHEHKASALLNGLDAHANLLK